MSLGGGSKRPAALPPPAPTIVTPGLEKARLDLLERMRRASSRQDSRVTLNMLQPTYGMPKAVPVPSTELGDISTKTATQPPKAPSLQKQVLKALPQPIRYGAKNLLKIWKKIW